MIPACCVPVSLPTLLTLAMAAPPAEIGLEGPALITDESIAAAMQRGDPATPGDGVAAYVAGHTVVFVGGFLNEFVRHRLTGNYFRHNIRALRSVDRDVVVVKVFPPSARAIADNVGFVRDQLAAASEHGGRKPLTVIGHSKGGVEVLLTLLAHPEMAIDGLIDDVVLIQSSIGGSPVSDCLADPGACRPPSALMRIAGRWIRRSYPEGLRSLRTADARRTVARALGSARDAIGVEGLEALGARVWYVRTSQAPDGATRRMRAVAEFLADRGHAPNDGMIVREDQRLADFGADLGETLDASHADLVCSGLSVSRKPRRYREAFTRLLIEALAGGR